MAATLFAAPVFGSSRIEGIVKWLFVANGILGILTPVAYAFNLPSQILLGGLTVLDIVMPFATAFPACLFRRAGQL